MSAVASSVGKLDSSTSSCDKVEVYVEVGVPVGIDEDEDEDGLEDTTGSGGNTYEYSGGKGGTDGIAPGGGRGNAESEIAE